MQESYDSYLAQKTGDIGFFNSLKSEEQKIVMQGIKELFDADQQRVIEEIYDLLPSKRKAEAEAEDQQPSKKIKHD